VTQVLVAGAKIEQGDVVFIAPNGMAYPYDKSKRSTKHETIKISDEDVEKLKEEYLARAAKSMSVESAIEGIKAKYLANAAQAEKGK
jgi:predicted metal-dependent hydrolase